MNPIYAVAFNASQGASGPRASASLSLRTEDTYTSLTIQWDKLPELQADDDPATWLYGVLSQVVMNFDDHEVTQVEVQGLEAMQEGDRA